MMLGGRFRVVGEYEKGETMERVKYGKDEG